MMEVTPVQLSSKAGVEPWIVAMIRRSGRSWWQARYSDGRVLSEWETLTDKIRLPVSLGRSSRWEDVPKQHMVGLRLLCPNGMCAELEAPEGCRFFQLKHGFVDVVIGGSGSSRHCAAHIIGMVTDANGSCYCRAWESAEKRLIQFNDNVFNMRYRGIGPLSLAVQGVRI